MKYLEARNILKRRHHCQCILCCLKYRVKQGDKQAQTELTKKQAVIDAARLARS